MKRSIGMLLLPAILSLLAADVLATEILTNEAILTMVKAGLGEELIITKIKASRNQFDLSTNDVLQLKHAGVSEKIVQAMIENSPGFPAPGGTLGEQEAIALYRQERAAEAVAAFDRLIAEKPNDDGPKIWKALALLEQARGMKDANTPGYKPLVVSAYAILQPLGRKHVMNPDWNFAMAKAFWLNDRPTWAKRAAGKALDLRANFAEPQLLLGDLAYEDEVSALTSAPGQPRREIAQRFAGQATRKEYEKALALLDLTAPLRAEAFYKLGMAAADLEKRKGVAREFWEKAAAADPASRYGRMAQEKLKAVPAK